MAAGDAAHVLAPPYGMDRPPRAGCEYWAGLRRDALDSGCGCPCDDAAQVPAVRAVRQRGDASDSVIDRLLLLPVVPQRQVRTVQAVQKTGDSTAQFLGEVGRARCCERQVPGDGPDSAEAEVPQVQFLDVVVLPVV